MEESRSHMQMQRPMLGMILLAYFSLTTSFMAWSEGLEKSWGLIWIRSCIVVCVWISDFTLGHEEVVIRMGIKARERTHSD